MRLISVQVGQPKTLEFEGEMWTSAIGKTPVKDRLFLDRTNLVGDRQANREHHGGQDKAVCCFPSEHYAFWQQTLGLETFPYGAFGENFTLVGLTEECVCIGDIYAVGTARVQVSQPRQPCINLARRWNYPEMPNHLIAQGHTGFYLRVLQTGEVGAGDSLELQERPCPEVSVAFVNGAKYRKEGGVERAALLADLVLLNRDWRWTFRRRLTPNK